MVKVFFLVLVIFSCNSCIKTYHTSGHLFEPEELQALHTAKSKQDVEHLLGSPSTISLFGMENWYYITSKKETIAFLSDKVVEQNIVEITFNKDESVNKVAWYNEKDAKPLKLIEEYTVTKGTNTTTLQKFFYNFGRFRDNKQVTPPTPRSGF